MLTWVVIPNLKGSVLRVQKNAMWFIMIFQYLPRVFLIYPLSSQIIDTSGFVTESAWTGAAYNLMLYLLASHVSRSMKLISLFSFLLVLGIFSKEMLDFVHAILSLSKFHLRKKKTILVYVMSNASVTIYYENCCDSKILFSNLHYYRIKFDFFFPFNFEKFHHGPPIIFIPFSK